MSSAIEDYIDSLLPSPDPVLQQMEEAGRRERFPIVGPQVGRLLAQLAHMTAACQVFEMGSGFGYSAYWFLKGMPAEGRVVLTDGSAENLERARTYFDRAGLTGRVTLEQGDALEIIERYPGPFDIIFNDIDKASYPEAFRKAVPRLRKGGLFVSDNVLWFGTVIGQSIEPDVLGIQEHNRLVAGHPGLLSTIVPVRDGVSISIKTSDV